MNKDFSIARLGSGNADRFQLLDTTKALQQHTLYIVGQNWRLAGRLVASISAASIAVV
jgi:hypothetical protein